MVFALFAVIAGVLALHQYVRAGRRETASANLREQLEERVRERSAQLRLAETVVQNTSEGVMVVDADGRIVSVNPAFSEITGYSAQEAIGCTPRMLRSDHHDEDFYRDMLRVLLAEGKWQGEIWNRRKSGEIYPEWLSIDLVTDADGTSPCYVAVFTDITEKHLKDEHLRHLAYHDGLTGLPNRSLLFDRLQHALEKARRDERGLAVFFLDLDGFKAVNDQFGHEVGDLLLQEVAGRLRGTLRATDTVARLGGDEFIVLLEDIEGRDHVESIAAGLVSAISQPYDIASMALTVGASLGIALFPDHGDSPFDLLKHADAAMYAIKRNGKGGYRF